LRGGPALPEPTRRLAFRPFHGKEEVFALMTSALTGTLDAHSRADLTGMTAREAAAKHYGEELARYTTPRAWWQVATHTAVPRVRAATDLANTPMAAAFRRAGYVDFEREITMVWG
jgi:RimJ/RimL family protein N-acetyltransferase